MKFFEFADALHPLLPGGLTRAPYLCELISMFTTVTEAEWATRADPSVLPSDATLERMASTNTAFTKKLANAITARWGIKNFVTVLDTLELETQQLITDNITAYGEHVRLDHFPEDIARLLVEIIHEKAGTDNGKAKALTEIAVQTARVRYEKLLLARSRGCTNCGRLLGVSSHGQQADSYTIIFLDSEKDEYSADDFAAVCKPCGEKYELSHTPQDIDKLRQSNRSPTLSDRVDEGLEEAGKLDFERMRDDIWGAWRVLVDAGLSQDEVWERLTKWIDQHTQVDEYACGVVVSFLTQICELFKPRRQIL